MARAVSSCAWEEAEPREKGVDVDMAIEAVRFVLEDRCDVAVRFSHDTDLIPAIHHHELDENHFAWVEDRVNYAYKG